MSGGVAIDVHDAHGFSGREVINKFRGLAESGVGKATGSAFVDEVAYVMIHLRPEEAQADARKGTVGIEVPADWI